MVQAVAEVAGHRHVIGIAIGRFERRHVRRDRAEVRGAAAGGQAFVDLRVERDDADAVLEGYNLAEERYIGVEDKGDAGEVMPADVAAASEPMQAAPAV